MAIDDELDAIRSQYPDLTSNAGFDISIKALTLLGGATGIGASILEALRSHFSPRAMVDRLQALIQGIESMVHRLEGESSDNAARVARVEEKLRSGEFARALVTVANVAVFTPSLEKVREFGAILGYEAGSVDEEGWDEAASLVDDLSRLTEKDLDALCMMIRFQGEHVRDVPNPQEHDALENAFVNVICAAVDSGMSNYEFYGRALSLSGFGLARPITGKPTLWAPQDMVFGPTPRGKRLIEIISQRRCEL